VSADLVQQFLGNSTDPRDKVFAVLAMTPEGSEETIAPDYRQSTRGVFLSVARFLILHHQSLDVLCHYQGKSSQYNLPLWAPDWTMNRVAKTLAPPSVSQKYYTADGGRPANINFGDKPETLVVKGKVVDAVRHVGAVYDEANNPSVTLRTWEAIALSMAVVSTGRSAEAAFMETLIAYPAYKGSKQTPFERFYAAWRSMMFDKDAADSSDTSGGSIFQKFLQEKCHGRSFFVTRKGYMGLGPAEMQAEQVVVVMLGGRVPFVLRRQENHRYQLVGECYTHGFMKGEAVQDDEDAMEIMYLI
jgi:hypothetical protein